MSSRELEALGKPQPQEQNPRAGNGHDTSTPEQSEQIDLDELSPVLVELIVHGTINNTPPRKRGPAFLRLVRGLRAKGYDFASVLATLKAHPNGVQGKYANRLDKELDRAWAKCQTDTRLQSKAPWLAS